MPEIKERIKDFAGDLLYNKVLKGLKPAYTGPEGGHLLLLPPSDLDGSFGDELMVCAFIDRFSKGKPVTIWTDHLIRRDDFLSPYPQVRYEDGFHVRNYTAWEKMLERVSGIFIIGADALDGAYSSRHSMRYLRLAEMAHKMGKPVYFSGFSVSNQATPVVKHALAEVADYSLLKARDLDSYQRLSKFVPSQGILQVSDMAFVCPYNETEEKTPAFQKFKSWADRQHGQGKMILAVCPNSIQADKIGLARFLKEFEQLLNTFREKADIAVLYLYHDIRPLANGLSDKDISRMLYDSDTEKESIFFPEGISNGIALKSYLKYADATVTGRMHFGISGIAAGKPMFGICYANKFEGMLRLFEIDPSHALVDYTEMEKSGNVIARFLQDWKTEGEKIAQHLGSVRRLSLLNGSDIA